MIYFVYEENDNTNDSKNTNITFETLRFESH
jgi:hypothetical protein